VENLYEENIPKQNGEISTPHHATIVFGQNPDVLIWLKQTLPDGSEAR
jgi:hypothetical protein